MSIAACLSTGKDDWETPDDLFARYHKTYRFVLDAAANRANAKLPRYLGPGSDLAEDALAVAWPLEQGNIWLNPPYSRGLQARFIQKALEEHDRYVQESAIRFQQDEHRVVCLLPARTDTRLFHEIILPNATVEFLRGRVKFKGAAQGAPFPSMIVIF